MRASGWSPCARPVSPGGRANGKYSGGALEPGQDKRVRKLSVMVAGNTAFTAYGKGTSATAARLEKAWGILRCSLRAAVATDG